MRFNKIATVLQNAVSRSRTQMLTTGARRSLRPYSSLKFGPELFFNSASRLHSRNCSWQRYSFQPWRRAGYSSQPTSFPDPSRPDFFYHLVDPPTPVSHEKPAFALSFLSSPPVSSNSSTIVGWLPASSTGASGETSLADFKENRTSRPSCSCSQFDHPCSRLPGNPTRGHSGRPSGGHRRDTREWGYSTAARLDAYPRYVRCWFALLPFSFRTLTQTTGTSHLLDG